MKALQDNLSFQSNKVSMAMEMVWNEKKNEWVPTLKDEFKEEWIASMKARLQLACKHVKLGRNAKWVQLLWQDGVDRP